MDRKQLISIVATFLVTAVLATLLSTYQRGSQALTEDQIKDVLAETQVTVINGETKTYGEALSIINDEQVRMKATIEAFIE